jgi:hypothetical protein
MALIPNPFISRYFERENLGNGRYLSPTNDPQTILPTQKECVSILLVPTVCVMGVYVEPTPYKRGSECAEGM